MAVNPENYFTGDGSTTSYNLTFEYIDETDVKVTLDGVVTTAYSFANATTILFDTAPSSDVEIRIYRDTNVDELKSTFFAGSSIRAQDLNQNFEQNNFAVQEIKAYTWDNETDTIHSNETWVSSDTQIATTAAIDNRVDAKIDTAITNDIGTDGTGITVTDDGDGTITLGLADNAIDFSKIKDADIITDTEQDAGSPSPTNDNLFSALGAARRFDTIVNQAEQSSAVNWEVGKTWLQNDSEKTVRIWDGSAWVAVASGGAFTTLPKVVYVDSVNGDDSLEGHRISNPKRTIKAAIQQINSETDEVGDGSVVIVAPGVYQEAAPIDIQKKNVSIIGQALRSCIVHPTPATEENTLFRLNSGSYVANLTLTGVKASGTRGGNSLDTDSTYGLPTNQGWNFAFYPGATIVKSPYIANCTNFSDSEIDNSDLNAFNPRGGLGGDTDSAPTGGGILVDGAAVSSSSPLRSMVCDSYTHVGLDGPGIFVTNNGYCQATSSYAFFTHYHIKTLNGGQANLAASTTDFGRYGLVAQGRSSSAIFTATTTATASDGATTFTIGAPSAGGSWFGSATRPQSNMVVDIGGNTYSIIGATANGSGWDVEISRPDANNLSTNLGLNGAVSSGSSVSFFLRSMIASSGHTMEYVGSGTNYSALPENGGVPIEANEIIELSNGKVWAATTNHQGKFTVGPTFNVDQVTGYVNIANGAIGIEKLIENLDLNSYTLSDSTGDVTIDDTLDMNSNQIVNVTGLTMTGDITMNAQSDVRFADSDSSNYVAIQAPATIGTNYTLTLPTSTGNAGEALITDASGNLSWSSSIGTVVDQIIEGDTKAEVIDTGSNGRFVVSTEGQERLRITSDGKLGVGTANAAVALHVATTGTPQFRLEDLDTADAYANLSASNGNFVIQADPQNVSGSTRIGFEIDGSERARIDSSGRLGVGTSSPSQVLDVSANDARFNLTSTGSGQTVGISIKGGSGGGDTYNYIESLDSAGAQKWYIGSNGTANTLAFKTNGNNERMRIDSSGNVGIGTTSPARPLDVNGSVRLASGSVIEFGGTVTNYITGDNSNNHLAFGTNSSERARIDSAGRVGIGTTSPVRTLHVQGDARVGPSGGQYILFAGGSTNNIISRDGVSGTSGNALAFSTGTGASAESMRIDTSGNVGIGVTSPAQKLQVTDGTLSNFYVAPGYNSGQGTTLAVGGGEYIEFATNGIGNPRARIDSSGRLLVGTSTSIDADSSIQAFTTGVGSSVQVGRFSNNDGGCNFWLLKSRGGAVGTNAIVQSGDLIGSLGYRAANGTGYNTAAEIRGEVDGTPGVDDMPGRLVFSTTADGASSPTERMRIASDGALYVQDVYDTTTINAANVEVNSNGRLRRSTSSAKYKTNVQTLEDSYADAILNCRPVWYQSLCKGDNPDHGHWGFIAEEVAEVDPRLVLWKTIDISYDEKGSPVETPCDPQPEGVFYDRFVPHLLNLIKRQQQAIETLEAKVAALEAN